MLLLFQSTADSEVGRHVNTFVGIQDGEKFQSTADSEVGRHVTTLCPL